MPDEMKPYNPSLRERLAAALRGDSKPGSIREHLVSGMVGGAVPGADQGMPLVDFSPLGIVFAKDEAERALNKGKYGEAALNAMGMIPAAGPGMRLTEEAAAPLVKKLAQQYELGDLLGSHSLKPLYDNPTTAMDGHRMTINLTRQPSPAEKARLRQMVEDMQVNEGKIKDLMVNKRNYYVGDGDDSGAAHLGDEGVDFWVRHWPPGDGGLGVAKGFNDPTNPRRARALDMEIQDIKNRADDRYAPAGTDTSPPSNSAAGLASDPNFDLAARADENYSYNGAVKYLSKELGVSPKEAERHLDRYHNEVLESNLRGEGRQMNPELFSREEEADHLRRGENADLNPELFPEQHLESLAGGDPHKLNYIKNALEDEGGNVPEEVATYLTDSLMRKASKDEAAREKWLNLVGEMNAQDFDSAVNHLSKNYSIPEMLSMHYDLDPSLKNAYEMPGKTRMRPTQ